MLGEFARRRHRKRSGLMAESLNQAAAPGVPGNNGWSRAAPLQHGGSAVEAQFREDGRSSRTVALVAMLRQQGAHMLLEKLHVLRRHRLRLCGRYRAGPKSS